MFKSCSRHCERSSVVEHHLAKVGVAGSNPIRRLTYNISREKATLDLLFYGSLSTVIGD